MFYHILSNFEFELMCHMYIISLNSIMFELLCPIIQCPMSIVVHVCLQCAQCVLSSNSNSCCEQSPNNEKKLYSSLREFYTWIVLYYIDDSAMCITIELCNIQVLLPYFKLCDVFFQFFFGANFHISPICNEFFLLDIAIFLIIEILCSQKFHNTTFVVLLNMYSNYMSKNYPLEITKSK